MALHSIGSVAIEENPSDSVTKNNNDANQLKACTPSKVRNVVYWRQIQNAAIFAVGIVRDRETQKFTTWMRWIWFIILCLELFFYSLASLSNDFGTIHFKLFAALLLSVSVHSLVLSLTFVIVESLRHHRDRTEIIGNIRTTKVEIGCKFASELSLHNSGRLSSEDLSKLFCRRRFLRQFSDLEKHTGTNLVDAVFLIKRQENDECQCGSERCKYDYIARYEDNEW